MDAGVIGSLNVVIICFSVSNWFKYYSLPLLNKHTVLSVRAFSRTVTEEMLHIGLMQLYRELKTPETTQPFSGMMFCCCFLSWITAGCLKCYYKTMRWFPATVACNCSGPAGLGEMQMSCLAAHKTLNCFPVWKPLQRGLMVLPVVRKKQQESHKLQCSSVWCLGLLSSHLLPKSVLLGLRRFCCLFCMCTVRWVITWY